MVNEPTARSIPPLGNALIGAFVIAFSPIFVAYANDTPVTVAFFRCLYALPALVLIAWWARRRAGVRWPVGRQRMAAAAAGVCFAADLVLWHESIGAVGAGLATILANTQVVVVGPIAWLLWSERPTIAQFVALPVSLAGVVMISGVLDPGAAFGDDPVWGAVTGLGTAIAYTGFLLLLRQSAPPGGEPVAPLAIATAVACVCCAAYGALAGGLNLVPTLPSHAWLVTLALTCQVFAWILITVSLARLPAVVVSLTLTLQPALALVLGIVLLVERPSVLQLLGALLVLVTIVLGRPQGRTRAVEV